MSKKLQRTATAYHEAGHAVAAIRLGISIGRKGVSIVGSGDASGAVVELARTSTAFASHHIVIRAHRP